MRGNVIEISPSPSRSVLDSDADDAELRRADRICRLSPGTHGLFARSADGNHFHSLDGQGHSGIRLRYGNPIVPIDCGEREASSILVLAMQRITRDKLTPVFDRRLPPVARVEPGEMFVVETEDSRGGRTRVPEHTTPEYLLAMRKRGYHGNPVTGPIFVEGAQPGDTLAVHILEQKCDTLGYMGYWPFLFHLEDFFDQPSTVLCEIRDGKVIVFDDEIEIPVRPMIGTIGVAPAWRRSFREAWAGIAAMWMCRRSRAG